MAISPNTCIKFRWVNDEICEIYVDEDYVGELSHTVHGWAGIEETVNLLNRMILVKGWDVKIEGEPGV